MAQTMRQQPPLSSSPCAPSPKYMSHHFGQLLVGCCIPPSSRAIEIPGPIALSIYICFAALFDPPKRRVSVLPHTFRLVEFPLQRPTRHRHHRSVDCCVLSSRGSHPRPVLRPSLNLSMGAILVPQTRESVAVSANPGTVLSV